MGREGGNVVSRDGGGVQGKRKRWGIDRGVGRERKIWWRR
jgi:hypothetical protein